MTDPKLRRQLAGVSDEAWAAFKAKCTETGKTQAELFEEFVAQQGGEQKEETIEIPMENINFSVFTQRIKEAASLLHTNPELCLSLKQMLQAFRHQELTIEEKKTLKEYWTLLNNVPKLTQEEIDKEVKRLRFKYAPRSLNEIAEMVESQPQLLGKIPATKGVHLALMPLVEEYLEKGVRLGVTDLRNYAASKGWA